jgi:uncharacterized heparinase superfamily protein
VSPLSRAIAGLRRAGPKATAQAAARRASTRARAAARERALRRRPLQATPVEVAAALGGLTLEQALRGPVLAALPTAEEFKRSLPELDDGGRHRLLERAEAVAAHRFDLLGSGPVDLGPAIDWSLDFKSGRRWPLKHRQAIVAFHPDDSDYKVPWELSRFQHLPLLAAAYELTGERRFLAEIGAQLESWIEANPVEIGINWACTMDVAIRAANWIATLAIAPDAARERWAEPVAASLLLHGRFIRANLETAAARTNHYLSDVAGLLVVAALFGEGIEGADWSRFAIKEIVAEMEHQVREDGCGHEASIPYHRLVCELFVCGTQAGRALRPGAFPDWYLERLDAMLDFVASYTRPDGLAPQVGDNDDGRFLPLDDYGKADFRSHLHLFRQAGRPYRPATESAAFAAGGYYVMRAGDLFVLVRCGDTGVYGIGSHAHNDQLSFELCCGERPLIVDPGTYTYYSDGELRLRFRSTAFHSTLRVDGEEQNPMPAWPRFPLGDRSRAEAREWSPDATPIAFAGRHHGFEGLPSPATHERRLELDGEARTLTIADLVSSDSSHRLDWTFPLGDCDAVELAGDTVVADFGPLRLSIESPGAALALEDGWYSPHYGVKEPRRFVTASKQSTPGEDRTELVLRVETSTHSATSAEA